jgi:hypothetical protein
MVEDEMIRIFEGSETNNALCTLVARHQQLMIRISGRWACRGQAFDAFGELRAVPNDHRSRSPFQQICPASPSGSRTKSGVQQSTAPLTLVFTQINEKTLNNNE